MSKLPSVYEKLKRNVGRAFDMRSDRQIRQTVDDDETTSGLDYALNRGKVQDPSQKGLQEGLKIRRKVIKGF